MTKRITEDEVKKLYEEYQTPPHVMRHCRAVAENAVHMAEALNLHGYDLDIDLIRGAGLAHDVARTQDEHWNVCADVMQQLGYEDEAGIIRVHMFYPQFSPVDELNECDMVCLSDRLVKEDRYVGLDERIDYIIQKIPESPKKAMYMENILVQKARTQHLLDQMGQVIGQSVDSLLRGFCEDTANQNTIETSIK